MKKSFVCAVCVTVCMATLALMPALAQRQDSTQASQREDRPKMHRQGSNAIPQHYIVVLDIDATASVGTLSTTAKRAVEATAAGQSRRALGDSWREPDKRLRPRHQRLLRLDVR